MHDIRYKPLALACGILIHEEILAQVEMPQHTFERVVNTVSDIERKFGDNR